MVTSARDVCCTGSAHGPRIVGSDLIASLNAHNSDLLHPRGMGFALMAINLAPKLRRDGCRRFWGEDTRVKPDTVHGDLCWMSSPVLTPMPVS